jgi:hypothetical protein
MLEAGMQNPLGKDRGDMTYYNVLLAADVDFGMLTPVEIGLILFGRYQRNARESDNFLTDGFVYGYGITYTGALDFHVGLHMNFSSLTYRGTDTRFDASVISLFMRYDF